MTYIKETFDAVTFDQAKNIVLTPDPSDPKKFERERYEVFKENLNTFKTLLRSGCSALSYGCIGLFKFNEKTKNQKPKRSIRLTSSRFIKNSTTQAPRGN
ncbi:MAG: hypothetical protein EBT63_03345 [Proteobacteria bacterium]|nr:hypothetical protein [Pseudomonadota bacterium]